MDQENLEKYIIQKQEEFKKEKEEKRLQHEKIKKIKELNKQLRNEEKLKIKHIKQEKVLKKYDYNPTICSDCGSEKLRKKTSSNTKSSMWIDNNGKLWRGLKCPECYLKIEKTRNDKKRKTFVPQNCLVCAHEFIPKHKRQKFCSKKCLGKRNKLIKNCITCGKIINGKHQFCSKECNPRLKKKVYKVQCLGCLLVFTSYRQDKEWCSRKCRNIKYRGKYKNKQRIKHYKKLRERAQKNAKPQWVKWTEIIDFYNKCPPGYEIDHIIPLNHPEVCGLHAPINFQYLTKKENNLKSNKFDGTHENNSWRNI